MVRLSPKESATKFPVGTIKKGNDKNDWIVVKAKNNVKRWKLVKKKYESSLNKSLFVVKFRFNILDSSMKFKKVGKLNITKKVIIGDIKSKKSIPGFGKNNYNVYKLNDCLILSKKLLSKKSLSDIMWINKGNIEVYRGMYGFWDGIANLAKLDYKKFSLKQLRKSEYFVSVKDLDNSEIINMKGNVKLGVVSDSGSGDGLFVYYVSRDKSSILILSHIIEEDIVNEHQKYTN